MTLTILHSFAFLCGLVVGCISILLIQKITIKKGYLRIDHNDPDKDVYRIEVDGLVDRKVKKFILKVDHNADLSQK